MFLLRCDLGQKAYLLPRLWKKSRSNYSRKGRTTTSANNPDRQRYATIDKKLFKVAATIFISWTAFISIHTPTWLATNWKNWPARGNTWTSSAFIAPFICDQMGDQGVRHKKTPDLTWTCHYCYHHGLCRYQFWSIEVWIRKTLGQQRW